MQQRSKWQTHQVLAHFLQDCKETKKFFFFLKFACNTVISGGPKNNFVRQN